MKQKGKVLTVFRLEGGSGQEAQREEIGNSRRGGVGLPSYLPGGGNDNQSIFDKSLAAESYVDAVDICSSTVIVKTCSDIFYTIGQKKCPMPSAKIRNYSHSHNLVSQ